MKILYFDSLPSTHLYLSDQLKNKELSAPVMIVAKNQPSGIGSRGNTWVEVKEGLYFSFAIALEHMPSDLRLESSAIFYGFIFKELLKSYGSKVWLKYPNDLYLNDKKLGGILCSAFDDMLLVGIGLNIELDSKCDKFAKLDIRIDNKSLLDEYILQINSFTWKQIFSKYKLEFSNNLSYSFHCGDLLVSMRNATLCDDGSLLIDGKKVYNLRSLE